MRPPLPDNVMRAAPVKHTLPLDATALAAGGAGLEIGKWGYSIYVSETSNGGALLEICYVDGGEAPDEDWLPISPGNAGPVFSDKPFTSVRVRLMSGAPGTAGTYAYLIFVRTPNAPQPFAGRLPAVTAAGVLDVRQTPAGSTAMAQTALLNATSTLIAAANAARHSLIVFNPDPATTYYLNSGAAADAADFPLLPQSYIVLPNDLLAWYAYQASGGALNINTMEASY